MIGALAVQIPITQINSIMTGDRKWADQGLGETGEVYLVQARQKTDEVRMSRGSRPVRDENMPKIDWF